MNLKTSLLILIVSTCVVNAQIWSFWDIFGGRNQNQNQIRSNQRPRNTQNTWMPENQRRNYQRVNTQPREFSRNNQLDRNYQPQQSYNYFDDSSFRDLERVSPGALGSLSSIINPGSQSTNNVIGNTNTAYNTFGNHNSFIQNNPQ